MQTLLWIVMITVLLAPTYLIGKRIHKRFLLSFLLSYAAQAIMTISYALFLSLLTGESGPGWLIILFIFMSPVILVVNALILKNKKT